MDTKTRIIYQVLDSTGDVVMESGKFYWLRYSTPTNSGAWTPVNIVASPNGEVAICFLGSQLVARNFDIESVDICEARTPDQDNEFEHYIGKIRFGRKMLDTFGVEVDRDE